MTDAQNPKYLYSLTLTELLVKIVKGTIDPVELAQIELAKRGLDPTGQWVGYSVAEKILNQNKAA
jgi:hypothetical protein